MNTENWLARFHMGTLYLCSAALACLVGDIPRPAFGQLPLKFRPAGGSVA